MNTPSAKINPELIDQLYGTWTFVSQSEADLGYYKAKAYLVVHFMPDPSQTLGCSKDGCSEFQNQLCQGGGSACVNTETTPVEWSDVAALYQFGFQVDTGAVVKSHFRQGTGDWLGPYNVILAEAPKSNSSGGSTSSLEQQEETAEARRRLGDANGSTDDDGSPTTTTTEKGASSPLYVSRLVQTASSQFLKPPPQGNIISDDLFDEYAGLVAIQNTITTQTSYPLDLSTAEDPYAKQLNTCDNGNLQPVLPRFTIQAGTPKVVHYDDDVDGANTTSTFTTTTTTSALPRAQSNTLEFSLRYPILSLPFTNNNDNKSDNNNGKSKSNSNPLTKWWPTLQKRLTKPKIVHGPYCYNGALEAYTIDLNFAKQGQDPAWEFVKGCVNGLPCWQPDAPAAAPDHHYPGIPDGTASSLLKWVNLQLGAPGLIALSVLLAMSLICNLRLCCKIKRRRRQSQSQSQSQLQSQGDEEGGAVGAGTTSSSSSSSRDATGNTNMTTPRRQRRQPSRPTAAAATTRQSQQSQSQQPRSAQILTPSRLMKREPTSDEPAAAAAAASEMHTPLLPKTKKKKMNKNGNNNNNNNNNEKNTHADPSAPLPPPMDRTPASKNPPVSSNIMDRTPIATKVAGPKKKKKTKTTKEPSKASINTTTSTTSADIGTASTAIPEEGTTTA